MSCAQAIVQIDANTGWRIPIVCLELQVIYRKRATNYRALLRKMTENDKASYDPTPPFSLMHAQYTLILSCRYTYTHLHIHSHLHFSNASAQATVHVDATNSMHAQCTPTFSHTNAYTYLYVHLHRHVHTHLRRPSRKSTPLVLHTHNTY